MKQYTSKLITAFALTAIVAYVAGACFQFPLTSGKAAGEVGRVKAYSANIVEIDADNLQEHLLSDSVFCSQVTGRAILMQKQAKDFAELIRRSNELVGGNDSLQVTLDALNVPYQSMLNACDAIDTYVDDLSILSKGGKVKGFEQVYNNALLGYYLVNSKSGLVDTFRDEINKCMSESEINDNLADLSDSWDCYAVFCDLMNGNSACLKGFRNQEQLIGLRSQEQLMFGRNQEQLKGNRNQEQLNWRNQEQLNCAR